MAADDKAKKDARRDFLKKAATAGIAAPAAVTLMLAAGTKRAKAGPGYAQPA